jgi:outer membrane protein
VTAIDPDGTTGPSNSSHEKAHMQNGHPSSMHPLIIKLCGPATLVLLLVWTLHGCASLPPPTYENIRIAYPQPVYSDTETHRAVRSVDSTTPLFLAEAIETASKNNPDLVQAKWRIEQAKAMRTIAEAAFWPQLSVYTEYMQGDAPSAYLFKTIDQRMLPDNINFNAPGWFENFESGITGKMNLFNGFQDYSATLMAETDIDISYGQRAQVLNDLTAEVINTFYNILTARDFIRIAETSVGTVAEQLRITQVHYEGGATLKADVLSLEVRLAEAYEQLVSSRNRHHLARATLANLMGLDPAAWIEQGSPLAETIERPPPIPDNYDVGIIAALAHRPELLQARQQVVKSHIGLTAAKGSYLPRLDLMATYYLADPHLDYNSTRDNWTAALVLNWDIFTGFSRSAQVNQAQAMFRQMLAADRKVILQVKHDVKTSYLNRQEAASRYAVAMRSVESAEESFRLIKEQYQGGAVPITRYLEAELDRNRARMRSTAAYYDRIKADANVARALGVWALEITPSQE